MRAALGGLGRPSGGPSGRVGSVEGAERARGRIIDAAEPS
jgi:hypothetical protein